MTEKSEIIIKNHTDAFIKDVALRNDLALGAMAQDIEMMAVFKVPVDTGKLSRFIRRRRLSARHWEVRVDKEYAAYQERGMRADGSHRVRKYSRPGSGPHFLRDAGKQVMLRAKIYFRKAQKRSTQDMDLGKGLSSRTDVTSVIGMYE